MRGINWRNPKNETPKEGTIIAALFQHWKKHNPMSCEIMFGRVEYDNNGENPRACTDDMTGLGSWYVEFCDKDKEYADRVLAWMPAEEFVLPDWVPHDTHWGPK